MKLSEKIQKINQKGIENLNTKGISIPEDSTTDTIMDNILNIVNGGESDKQQIKCESNIDSVTLPVTLDTVEVQINNKTIIVDSSLSLEE